MCHKLPNVCKRSGRPLLGREMRIEGDDRRHECLSVGRRGSATNDAGIDKPADRRVDGADAAEILTLRCRSLLQPEAVVPYDTWHEHYAVRRSQRGSIVEGRGRGFVVYFESRKCDLSHVRIRLIDRSSLCSGVLLHPFRSLHRGAFGVVSGWRHSRSLASRHVFDSSGPSVRYLGEMSRHFVAGTNRQDELRVESHDWITPEGAVPSHSERLVLGRADLNEVTFRVLGSDPCAGMSVGQLSGDLRYQPISAQVGDGSRSVISAETSDWRVKEAGRMRGSRLRHTAWVG